MTQNSIQAEFWGVFAEIFVYKLTCIQVGLYTTWPDSETSSCINPKLIGQFFGGHCKLQVFLYYWWPKFSYRATDHPDLDEYKNGMWSETNT